MFTPYVIPLALYAVLVGDLLIQGIGRVFQHQSRTQIYCLAIILGAPVVVILGANLGATFPGAGQALYAAIAGDSIDSRIGDFGALGTGQMVGAWAGVRVRGLESGIVLVISICGLLHAKRMITGTQRRGRKKC